MNAKSKKSSVVSIMDSLTPLKWSLIGLASLIVSMTVLGPPALLLAVFSMVVVVRRAVLYAVNSNTAKLRALWLAVVSLLVLWLFSSSVYVWLWAVAFELEDALKPTDQIDDMMGVMLVTSTTTIVASMIIMLIASKNSKTKVS